MKNQVIKNPTKGKEYFGFTDSDIIVSSKRHNDISSLAGSLEKKGMLETIHHIPIDSISTIKYNENNSRVAIQHDISSKQRKFKITFDSTETRNAIANEIGQIRGLSKSFTAENKFIPLLLNIFFILIAILIATALTGIAYESANGGEIQEFTGRRSGIKNLLAKIASAIGPIGVGIIGGLAVLFFVWRAIKRWKNPANDILLS